MTLKNAACKLKSSEIKSDSSMISNLSRRNGIAIPNAIAEKLKRQSWDGVKRQHSQACLIVQAVTRSLLCATETLEAMLRKRGFQVDDSTMPRCCLVYPPTIGKRPGQFGFPHCASVRIDET